MHIFNFFLSLHHPNNHLENVSIFYLPLFYSVAKKTVLGRKKIEGATPPPHEPYKVTPTHVEYTLATPSYSYALFCNLSPLFLWNVL